MRITTFAFVLIACGSSSDEGPIRIDSTLLQACDTTADCGVDQHCDSTTRQCLHVIDRGIGIPCEEAPAACPYGSPQELICVEPGCGVDDERICVCPSDSLDTVREGCQALADILEGRCELEVIDPPSSCCAGDECNWFIAYPEFEGSFGTLIDCAYTAADMGACDDPSIMWDLCRLRAYAQ